MMPDKTLKQTFKNEEQPARQIWLGAGWKMHKLLDAATRYATQLAAKASPIAGLNLFVLPPYMVARDVAKILQNYPIRVGAQNMHWQDNGAWTGEVSAPMLKDCGLELVEIGHSERRLHFGETDEMVTWKVAAAQRHGLIPLVCFGETATERAHGIDGEKLSRQLDAALAGITETTPHLNPNQLSPPPLLLAYEPVWAIGEHGKAADPQAVGDRLAHFSDKVIQQIGIPIPILYGGNVSLENAATFLQQPAVGGLFVGRAALEIEGFLALCNIAEDMICDNQAKTKQDDFTKNFSENSPANLVKGGA